MLFDGSVIAFRNRQSDPVIQIERAKTAIELCRRFDS